MEDLEPVLVQEEVVEETTEEMEVPVRLEEEEEELVGGMSVIRLVEQVDKEL